MPDNLSVLAYAKLNLSLDITGTRPDGYHTLSTVMQSIDIYDTVSVERIADTENDERIVVTCNDDDIACDKTNTAYMAADVFFEYTGIKLYGVKIHIKKNIPAAAGLGGGSADAAAVICAMDRLFHTELSLDELTDIGSEVGMDVPFCIKGGTQLAEGLGAILTPLPDIENCAFLLVKDDDKSSTKDMYQKYDSLSEVVHPDTANIVEYICEGEIYKSANLYDNVFSPLWGDKFIKIRQALLDGGAINASLSGSGPVVFGIFEDEDDARRCKLMLDSSYEDVILCLPKNCGLEEK